VASEAGLRTPLLDFFRRGDVANDVKLLAAHGALAPRAYEQLGLLMLLSSDADPEIARTAQATLAAIPPATLAAFLGRSEVSTEMRTFFAARGIEPAEGSAIEFDEPLFDSSAEVESKGAEEDERSALQRIAALNVAQRLGLAMKGSREERAILIRDPNKIVAVAVLASPKLSDSEVESIAKMASVSDEVLRIIAHTRAWVKTIPLSRR
jgi:hypothetical protein